MKQLLPVTAANDEDNKSCFILYSGVRRFVSFLSFFAEKQRKRGRERG